MLKGLEGVEGRRKVVRVHLNSNELFTANEILWKKREKRVELNQMTLMLRVLLEKDICCTLCFSGVLIPFYC